MSTNSKIQLLTFNVNEEEGKTDLLFIFVKNSEAEVIMRTPFPSVQFSLNLQSS